MDDAHLEKLRRFALVAGLVLITYLLAGIIVEPDAHISVFGAPFRIARPDLLPVGLAIASFCGAARFYYYGLMLGTSPYRRRRDLIDGLTVHSDEYRLPGKPIKPRVFASGREIPMYWGARKFSTSPWVGEREGVEQRAATFHNAFPKLFGARAVADVVRDISTDEEGDQYPIYCVDVLIPRRCRAAAIFEDLDYAAPVWLNTFALLFYVWVLPRST